MRQQQRQQAELPAAAQVSYHEHIVTAAGRGHPGDRCGRCGRALGVSSPRLRCAPCALLLCPPCALCPAAAPPRTPLPALHPHALAPCASPAPWRCALCGHSSDSSDSSDPSDARGTSDGVGGRYHCAWCQYDLCGACVGRAGAAAGALRGLHPHALVPALPAWPLRCALGGDACAARPGASWLRCPLLPCDFFVCDAHASQALAAADAAAAATPPASPASPPPMPPKRRPRACNASNTDLADYLRKSGCIRSQALYDAFAAVDRALFVGPGVPAPYSGDALVVSDPEFVVKSAATYAVCLQALCEGAPLDAAFLAVSPGTGYANCIASLLFPDGASCGIDASAAMVARARANVLAFQGSCGSAARRACAVQLLAGDVFALGDTFDRVLVDGNAGGNAVDALSKLLRVGGRMAALRQGKALLYVRESAALLSCQPLHVRCLSLSRAIADLPELVAPSAPAAAAALRVSFGSALSPRSVLAVPPSIEEFLGAHRLGKYAEVFARAEIDQRALCLLTEADVESLGLPIGPRRLLIAEVARLRASPVSPLPAQAPPADLSELLRALGLERYRGALEREDIALDSLALVTEGDLLAMGLPLGPRRLLCHAIAALPGHPQQPKQSQPQQQLPAEAPREEELLSVERGEALGEGSFGTVWRGLWGGTTPVALKALRGESEAAMAREVCVLRGLRHPNVVSYYGVCRVGGALHMVVELALGSVLALLQGDDGAELGELALLGMALGCAAGMSYLASVRVVHRDLAARNLLYFDDAGAYAVKVADFGLAVPEDYYVARQRPVPVRWTAPEALARRRFSAASDVWSYGVVLWELWSRGAEPYAGVAQADVLAHLTAGGRLQQPPGCPDTVYALMRRCWAWEPRERPSFQQIHRELLAIDGRGDAAGAASQQQQQQAAPHAYYGGEACRAPEAASLYEQ
eukprot:m51a1_g14125 putative tyrosine-protein kinase frk (929) ;mRNA; r:200227-203631